MTPSPSRPVPCIPGDPHGTSCLAGLLLGVRCCPDGQCALCRRDHARMRRLGFTEAEALSRAARARGRLLSRCPACGFPPPPPIHEIPALPRLDRSGRTLSSRFTCRSCGRALPKNRRAFCSEPCFREHVRRTEMAGDDVTSPSPPPTYRVSLGRRP